MGNRIKEVGLDEATPETRAVYQRIFGDRDPVEEPGTATGSRGDSWTTLAVVPEILQVATEMVSTVARPDGLLKPHHRELALLRTAIVGESRFAYSQHLKVSRIVGVPESKLTELKGWTTSKEFDDAERALLAAVDEIVGRNLVEDLTFSSLKRHFTDAQIVELFFAVCTYRTLGMFARAVHVEFDNDTTDRMQEVLPTDAAATAEALKQMSQAGAASGVKG